MVKKGTKIGILAKAYGIENNIQFETIQHSKDLDSLFNTIVKGQEIDVYSGPNFENLDERLQSELLDFFTSLGIDEELLSFVNVLSLDKDQRLYASWLRDVNRIFSH